MKGSEKQARPKRQSLREIRKLKDLLIPISKLNEVEFKTILKHLDDDAISMIFASVYNGIYNDKLSDSDRHMLREKLWNDRGKLRKIASGGTRKFALKKRLVSQVGGGIPFIASLVLPFLINIISNQISKYTKKKAEKK